LKPLYKEDHRAVRSAAGTRFGFSREKAQCEIGWVPQVSIEEGMRRLIAWRKG
jgi:UDP-glucose 4-epimerase